MGKENTEKKKKRKENMEKKRERKKEKREHRKEEERREKRTRKTDTVTDEKGNKKWVSRATLVDSRDSVTDIKFAPRHVGYLLFLLSSFFSPFFFFLSFSPPFSFCSYVNL